MRAVDNMRKWKRNISRYFCCLCSCEKHTIQEEEIFEGLPARRLSEIRVTVALKNNDKTMGQKHSVFHWRPKVHDKSDKLRERKAEPNQVPVASYIPLSECFSGHLPPWAFVRKSSSKSSTKSLGKNSRSSDGSQTEDEVFQDALTCSNCLSISVPSHLDSVDLCSRIQERSRCCNWTHLTNKNLPDVCTSSKGRLLDQDFNANNDIPAVICNRVRNQSESLCSSSKTVRDRYEKTPVVVEPSMGRGKQDKCFCKNLPKIPPKPRGYQVSRPYENIPFPLKSGKINRRGSFKSQDSSPPPPVPPRAPNTISMDDLNKEQNENRSESCSSPVKRKDSPSSPFLVIPRLSDCHEFVNGEEEEELYFIVQTPPPPNKTAKNGTPMLSESFVCRDEPDTILKYIRLDFTETDEKVPVPHIVDSENPRTEYRQIDLKRSQALWEMQRTVQLQRQQVSK